MRGARKTRRSPVITHQEIRINLLSVRDMMCRRGSSTCGASGVANSGLVERASLWPLLRSDRACAGVLLPTALVSLRGLPRAQNDSLLIAGRPDGFDNQGETQVNAQLQGRRKPTLISPPHG